MLNIESHIPLGEWITYNEPIKDERDAKRLCARLLVFNKGTSIKPVKTGFQVYIWNNGRGLVPVE